MGDEAESAEPIHSALESHSDPEKVSAPNAIGSDPGMRDILGVRWLQNRWWMLGAALVSILFALVLVRLGVSSDADSRAYVRRPAYSIWSGLVLLQLPVWALLGVVCQSWASEIQGLPQHEPLSAIQRRVGWLAAASFLGALFLAQSFAMELPYERAYPDYLSERTVAMGAIVAVVAAVPAVALWGLFSAARAIDWKTRDATRDFSFLWSRQRDYVVCLGLILTLMVLTTAAKLNANTSFYSPNEQPQVPPTFVLVQGAWYAALMLGIFFPPYLATRRVGYVLVDELTARTIPITSNPPTLEDLVARRRVEEEYRKLIGLSANGRQQLEGAIVLLAPFLAAIFTTLLP